jgi:hypothetical protein
MPIQKLADETSANPTEKARKRVRSAGFQQTKLTKTEAVPARLHTDAAALKLALEIKHIKATKISGKPGWQSSHTWKDAKERARYEPGVAIVMIYRCIPLLIFNNKIG